MAIIINPTQMGPRELALVKQFIENNKNNSINDFVSKNHVYEVHFPDTGLSRFIQFTHDLFRRKSATKDKPDRYEVESGENDTGFLVARGCYGEVRQLLGTISPDKETGEIRFKSREEKMKSVDAFGRPKHRVVKKIVVYPAAAEGKKQPYPQLADVNSEVEASKAISYLGAKDAAVCHYHGTTTARVVFRMLEGKEFFGTLENLMKRKINLTVNQRIALSLSLLQTLKNEIHDKGYIHRDIKPENILFHATDNYAAITTYIVDFGFAIPMGIQDFKNCGSPSYVAPEIVDRPAKAYPQTDLFAMSKIIGYIWGASAPASNPADIMGTVAIQNNYRFAHLFSGVSDLSVEHQKEIRAALGAAHNKDPFARSSVLDLIGVFEKIEKSLSASPSVSMTLTPQSSVSSVSDASVDHVAIDIPSDTSSNASPEMTFFKKRQRSRVDEEAVLTLMRSRTYP